MFLHILLLVFYFKIANASEPPINSQLDSANSLCQTALTGNSEVTDLEVFFNENYLNHITEVDDVEAIVDEFYRIRNPFMPSHQYSNRERSLAIQLVKAVKGNVTKVARELNIAVETLRGWVLKYEKLYDVQIRNAKFQKTYTDEEKLRAIRRVMELGGNVSGAARELNIAVETLRIWVIRYEEENNVQIRNISAPYTNEYKRYAISKVVELGGNKHGVQIRNTKVYPIYASTEEFLSAIELVIEYGGNMSKAAKELGMPSTTLHRWVLIYEEKHNVQIRNTKVYPIYASIEEFLSAIELVVEYGGNVSKAAKELEMPSTTLHRWVLIYEEKHNVQIRNGRSRRSNLN